MWTRRSASALAVGAGLAGLAACGWAALAPLPALPRERVLVIPPGAGAAGAAALPSRVELILGVQDVLVLRNDDAAAQLVGGIEVPARTSLRIPFHRPGRLDLACSIHPSGRFSVSAREPPGPGWPRLWWRLGRLVGA
jgi:hypothetical protein